MYGRIFFSAFLLAAFALGAQAADPGRSLVPEEQVRAAAVKQFEQLSRTHAPAIDRAFSTKVMCIARALVEAIPAEETDPRIQWSIHVFEDPEANAFALPSGHVVVNSGLAGVTRSPDELASAIATPIASVVRKHAQKKLDRRVQAQLNLISPGVTPAQRSVPEQQEQQAVAAEILEADEFGRLIMKRAGFDPRAQPSLLEALASGRPLLKRDYAPRISASRAWLAQNAGDGEPATKPCMLLQ